MLHRYRQLIPTLLFAAGCASSLITGPLTAIFSEQYLLLNFRHYGAILATATTLIAYLYFRPYYKYVFSILFLFAFIGLINFTSIDVKIGLQIGELNVGLSPLLLMVGSITYFLNNQRINTSLFSIIGPSDEKITKIRASEIAEFKERFAKKSIAQLQEIVTTKKLVPTAVAAAHQLLQERQ